MTGVALPKGRLLADTAALIGRAGDSRATAKARLYRLSSDTIPGLCQDDKQQDIPVQVAVGGFDLGVSVLTGLATRQMPDSDLWRCATWAMARALHLIGTGKRMATSASPAIPQSGGRSPWRCALNSRVSSGAQGLPAGSAELAWCAARWGGGADTATVGVRCAATAPALSPTGMAGEVRPGQPRRPA
jgi:hypothetical protein